MLHIALTALGLSVIVWLVCFCFGSLMIMLVPGNSCGENVISKEFNGISAKPLLRAILIAFVVGSVISLAILHSWQIL